MNDIEPLVSVIIPVYNGEKFLEEAIESVLKQTYKNWELIIVDDGSTDSSKAIIDKHLINQQIRYIKHPTNKGIPSARNTGIHKANGRYISLLDQDDIWLNNKLEIQIEKFKKASEEIGLMFGCIDYIDSKGRLVKKGNRKIKMLPNKKSSIKYLFMHNFIPSITVIFKSKCIKIIGEFDEEIRGGADDIDLWIRIAGHYRTDYIKEVLALRRLHDSNFTNIKYISGDWLSLINKFIKKYPFLKSLKRKKMAQIYYLLGRHNHLTGKYAEARQLYLRALKKDCTIDWRVYLFFLLTFLKIKIDRRSKSV